MSKSDVGSEKWELINSKTIDGKGEVEVFKLNLGIYNGSLYMVYTAGYGVHVVHAPQYVPPVYLTARDRHKGVVGP